MRLDKLPGLLGGVGHRFHPLFAASAVVAIVAVLSAVFVFANTGTHPDTRPDTRRGGSLSAFPPLTLSRPLPIAEETTLADASAALGPLVLPSTSLVESSDVGTVWAHYTGPHAGVVAVTFPSQDLVIRYERPSPSMDPETDFPQMAKTLEGAEVIDLAGTPALVFPRSDSTGQNLGSVAVEINDTVRRGFRPRR